MDEQAKIHVLMGLGLTEDTARVIIEDAPRPDSFGLSPADGDEVLAGTFTESNCFAVVQRNGALSVKSMHEPCSAGLRAEMEDSLRIAERHVRSLKAMIQATDALGGDVTAIDPVDEEALATLIPPTPDAPGTIDIPDILRLTADEKEIHRLHFSEAHNERIEDILAASPVYFTGWECDHTILVLKLFDGSLKAHVVAGTGASSGVGKLLQDSIRDVSDGLPKMDAMLNLVRRVEALGNKDREA